MRSRPEEEMPESYLAWYEEALFESSLASLSSITTTFKDPTPVSFVFPEMPPVPTPVNSQNSALSTQNIQKKLSQLSDPFMHEDPAYQLPQNKQKETLPISQICPLLFPSILPLQCRQNILEIIPPYRPKKLRGPRNIKNRNPFKGARPYESVLQLDANLSEIENPKTKKLRN